ncbi:SpoVT/AbrB family regulatory protein [Kroppenstedtia guangzhouensis]|jgi:AbrB family transcriptional regulator, transcriptional pleiotropic regulator of transition state genes|uniref:SpoVT/AbrB family regulatory protein n=1 Tax=Kroppenstedtia guangzhouensis TaxID=1274356 RepID=A0ABQ1GEI0_9BACL|nr:AbrB/MazE/SpoVT family DNA-binding domain-containing protein [Kroppenstedtia guangzhouensis]GGA42184.1 SpoVT/AbrB family regulatory protein [Kroppenstedtia guangzhouensis]
MQGIGIVRKVDHLGRVVLPKELRETMNIHAQDGVEIFMENEQIVLRKYNPSCIFCDSSESLFHFKGKIVCRECLEDTSSYVL